MSQNNEEGHPSPSSSARSHIKQCAVNEQTDGQEIDSSSSTPAINYFDEFLTNSNSNPYQQQPTEVLVRMRKAIEKRPIFCFFLFFSFLPSVVIIDMFIWFRTVAAVRGWVQALSWFLGHLPPLWRRQQFNNCQWNFSGSLTLTGKSKAKRSA